MASDSTDGEIICIYKDDKKNKSIQRYMESMELYTGAPTVYWEDKKVLFMLLNLKKLLLELNS